MGKFVNAADEYAYELSLDGRAETVGDVQYRGHFAGVEFSLEETTHLLSLPVDLFTEEDVPFRAFAIVQEDTQGFVSVEFFTNESTYRATFSDISTEYDTPEGWDA